MFVNILTPKNVRFQTRFHWKHMWMGLGTFWFHLRHFCWWGRAWIVLKLSEYPLTEIPDEEEKKS